MFFLPLLSNVEVALSGLREGQGKPSETADLGQRSQEGPFCLGNTLQGSVGSQASATGPEQIGTKVKWQSDLYHEESSPRAAGC